MRSLLPLSRRGADDPFTALRHDVDRLFGRLGAGLSASLLAGERGFPALDMTDEADAVRISAELPGVAREDVTVEAAEHGLVIRGEKKSEHEEKADDAWMLERSYGSFLRRIPLPFSPEPEGIEASFKDGVLHIVVPKPEEAKRETKRIEIKQG